MVQRGVKLNIEYCPTLRDAEVGLRALQALFFLVNILQVRLQPETTFL